METTSDDVGIHTGEVGEPDAALAYPSQCPVDQTQRGTVEAMPPGNVTEMTGEARALIATWLATDRR